MACKLDTADFWQLLLCSAQPWTGIDPLVWRHPFLATYTVIVSSKGLNRFSCLTTAISLKMQVSGNYDFLSTTDLYGYLTTAISWNMQVPGNYDCIHHRHAQLSYHSHQFEDVSFWQLWLYPAHMKGVIPYTVKPVMTGVPTCQK